jgi:hypothetical protein
MAEHLRIKLADPDSGYIDADRVTLQCYSSCARGLPASAEEWDISQLLIEGQPVQRETVVAYINAVSQHLNNQIVIEEQDGPPRSMKGLASLLAFADAVGTSRGLLLAVDAQVSGAELVAEVKLGDLDLELTASGCYFFPKSGMRLTCVSPSISLEERISSKTVATAGSAEEKKRLVQQFIEQVEALMHLALQLQLPQLQRMMQQCLSCNSCWDGSLLNTAEAMKAVVSARVMNAGTAAGCCALQEAVMNLSSMRLGTFGGGSLPHRHQLVRPLNLTAKQQQPMEFKAGLLEDYLCYRKGQVVDVTLDLFNSSVLNLQLDQDGSTPTPQFMHIALGRHFD